MKVLLIYPPVSCVGSGLVVKSHAPMGLMYLAAYTKQIGHEVKLLDAFANGKKRERKTKLGIRIGMSWDEIKEVIDEFEAEVVGISVMFTAYFQDALSLARKIKRYKPNLPIVFGGSHVSVDPGDSLQNKPIDYIVYGEGEITFEKLLIALSNQGKGLEKINGLAYRKKGEIFVNPPAELVQNLDSLPFPDWDMLDLSKYDLGDSNQVMRKPCFTVETSRGCPNQCKYCSSFIIWRRHWRGRSPENVVDEIEQLVKKYGAREIQFYDDSMSVNKKRLVGMCQEIINRKLDIKWTPPNGIAHWTLDKEMLKLMKRSGCYQITFGIESGDPETRRWVGKPYSLDQAKELTKYANKLGLWTLATNIIGFPYETKEQINRTLNFAIDSGVDIALFFRLGLRPGAPVYEIFKAEGWLPRDLRVLFSENLSVDTKFIKGSELVEIQKQMYETFYQKRWRSWEAIPRLLRKVHSVEDLRYVIKQVKFLYNFRTGWIKKRSGSVSEKV